MGVTCQILINHPKEGFHRSGSAVSGCVKYIIDEPTEYKNITLSLIGKGHCTWVVHYGRIPVTYHGSEQYTRQDINVLGTTVKSVILKPGSYECPFEFILPEDIPSTIQTHTCAISYKIRLTFTKSKGFSSKKKFSSEITVKGIIKSNLIEGKTIFGLEKKLAKPFSEKKPVINVKCELPKTTFNPGENIELNFVVSNETNININSIKTELEEHTVYTSKGGTQKFKDRTFAVAETVSVPRNSITNLSSVLSIDPKLYSIQNTKIMEKKYAIKMTLKLPVPYSNEMVETPIFIGLQRLEKPEEFDSTSSVEDSPPSYWEVMNEDSDSKGFNLNIFKNDDSDNDEGPSQSSSSSMMDEKLSAQSGVKK